MPSNNYRPGSPSNRHRSNTERHSLSMGGAAHVVTGLSASLLRAREEADRVRQDKEDRAAQREFTMTTLKDSARHSVKQDSLEVESGERTAPGVYEQLKESWESLEDRDKFQEITTRYDLDIETVKTFMRNRQIEDEWATVRAAHPSGANSA